MIVRAFFLRPVIRKPFRFLATIAGVAIGVASIVATILASQAAIRSMQQGVEELAGSTQLEITRPGDVDENLLGTLRPLAKDAYITPVIDELVIMPELNDTVRVLGLDFLVDRSFRDLQWKGEDDIGSAQVLEILRGEGVLVPRPLAESLGLKAGDAIHLSILSKDIPLKITAVFQPQKFSSTWDRVVLMDIAMAQELFERIGRIDRIELVPRKSVPIAAIQQALKALLPGDTILAEPGNRREQSERMVRALRFNLTALSAISLMVGAVLVAITLYTSVIQRRYIIALLRSLGASRGQVAWAVLSEASAIGLAGGLLGVAGGVWGAKLALASVRSTVAVVVQGVPASEIQLTFWLAVLGISLGLGVSLAASIWAVGEALRTPPLQGLKSEHPGFLQARLEFRSAIVSMAFGLIAYAMTLVPPINDLPFAALGSALAVLCAFVVLSPSIVDLVGRAAHWLQLPKRLALISLAIAGLSAGRQRSAWAANAICLSAALAVAMTVMISSFRQTVTDWSHQTMLSDLWVQPVSTDTGIPAGRLDPAIADAAFQRFGVENVDPFHRSEALVDGEQVTLGAGVFDPVRSKRGGVPFRDGRASKDVFASAAKNGSILVNEPFTRRFGLQEGDTVKLQVRGETIERKIEAVFYDYSNHQGLIVMDRADYLHYYPNDGPEGIGIFLPEGMPLEKGREEFRKILGGRWQVQIMLNAELREEVMRTFDRTFAITRALQIISSIVAAIAVLTVLYALVGERRQDLALIRSLGGTRRQVIQVIVAKAGILGMMGLLSGLGAGAIVGIILVKIVNLQSFHWTLRLIWPWASLAGLIVFVMLACTIAGLFPAWTVSKMNLQETLRENE